MQFHYRDPPFPRSHGKGHASLRGSSVPWTVWPDHMKHFLPANGTVIQPILEQESAGAPKEEEEGAVPS